MATHSTLAVIVAQAGADVACHVEAAMGHGGSVEVLQQAVGESETALSRRLRARLSALSASGVTVSSASFVAKPGFGSADVLGAAGLVRSLVSLMVAVGASAVHLYAAPRDRQAELALTALSSALGEQLRGTGVTLDARLGCVRPDQTGVVTASAAARSERAAVA